MSRANHQSDMISWGLLAPYRTDFACVDLSSVRPSLVLLDEIGTGTDPAQGAALAQAVLEELVNLGSRVIVTTHYQRIKELAAADKRFRVAAMEFIENRPTYRLRQG